MRVELPWLDLLTGDPSDLVESMSQLLNHENFLKIALLIEEILDEKGEKRESVSFSDIVEEVQKKGLNIKSSTLRHIIEKELLPQGLIVLKNQEKEIYEMPEEGFYLVNRLLQVIDFAKNMGDKFTVLSTNILEIFPPERQKTVLNYVFKICVIGPFKAGKTSLIRKLLGREILREYISTLGADFAIKTFQHKNNTTKLRIWDVGGQKLTIKMIHNFFSNTHGVLVVFDLSDRNSYSSIGWWINQAINSCGKLPMVLVGNKKDLVCERSVQFEEVLDIADKYDMPYIETSALTGENVAEAFELIEEIIIHKMETEKEKVHKELAKKT